MASDDGKNAVGLDMVLDMVEDLAAAILVMNDSESIDGDLLERLLFVPNIVTRIRKSIRSVDHGKPFAGEAPEAALITSEEQES